MFLEQAYRGRNKWYLYLATLLIVFVSTQIGSIPLGVYALFHHISSGTDLAASASDIMKTNLGFALMLIPFAAGLGVLVLCINKIHKKKTNDVITSRARIDRKRIVFSALLWIGLSALSLTFDFYSESGKYILQFDWGKFIPLFAITLVLIPLQTGLEEIVFRGYLMQGTALLVRYKWVALILTSVAFGLMHSWNPEVEESGFWVAMPQYILMGFIMGYAALKDGGLELALGMHAGNNIFSALTVSSDISALKTHAIFLDTAPVIKASDSIFIIIYGLVFILICRWKYGYADGNNIRDKILPPNK